MVYIPQNLDGDSIKDRCHRVLRACPGQFVFPDIVGRRVARYRHVFSRQQDKRKQAHEESVEFFQRMESLGWGVLLPANESGCQVFRKTPLDSLSPQAKKEFEKANVPALFIRPFPPTVLQSRTSCMSENENWFLR